MKNRMSTFHALLMLVLAACVVAAPSVVCAQDGDEEESGADNDEEARVHFRLGTAYYESGRFAEAAGEYQQAYDLSHRPTLLYNLFLAWRDASELGHAVEALRAYLSEGSPPSDTRIRLEAQLEGMERRLEQQRAAAATQSQSSTTSTPTQTTTENQTGTETGRDTTTTTPTGGLDDGTQTGVDTSDQALVDEEEEEGGGVPLVPIIVMGAGGALVVVSVITGVMALGKKGELDDMCTADGACAPGFESARDSGRTLATVTDIMLFGGLATVAVGAVLLALGVGSADEEEDTSLGFACTGDGCAASARFRF